MVRRHRALLAAVLAGAAVLLASGASARPAKFSVHEGLFRLPRSMSMLEGARVLSPFGWSVFCQRHPGECGAAGGASVETLSVSRWAELQGTNAEVNARIAPEPEGDGQDDWRLGAAAGDCEDYALQKRHDLIRQGWPVAALSLAVVTLRDGREHLVLVARTSQGDFVLDNLRAAVLPWTRTGYRFVKRQSDADPRVWVAVAGAGAPRFDAQPAPAPSIRVASADIFGEGTPALRGTLTAAVESVRADWDWR